jgi:hypothetical protein
VKLVDTSDSKSDALKSVPVRVRPPVPKQKSKSPAFQAPFSVPVIRAGREPEVRHFATIGAKWAQERSDGGCAATKSGGGNAAFINPASGTKTEIQIPSIFSTS